ncbi:hypothetical protein [Ramlibacter alkalitolerans]|uniref:Uncharacterized protein n=1 Tax=Ramlibacter alkalitolerans TaxID=2039631 RepID=A0ABS1JU67_9BURK|nr:hypothetical protein [Ramlibacter alkalitolerans]MBL0427840.1 hypothetical protein [Ramlibacter alkalitolerans]
MKLFRRLVQPLEGGEARGWQAGYLVVREEPDLPPVQSAKELRSLARLLLWRGIRGDDIQGLELLNEVPLAPGLLLRQRVFTQAQGLLGLEISNCEKGADGAECLVGRHSLDVSLLQAQCILEQWVKQRQAALLHQVALDESARPAGYTDRQLAERLPGADRLPSSPAA